MNQAAYCPSREKGALRSYAKWKTSQARGRAVKLF